MKELLEGDGLELPYRVVYKAGVEGKELFSLEKMLLAKVNGISIGDPPAQAIAA